MKKKCFSLLLTLLAVFTAALSVFAENGPFDKKRDGEYPGYLALEWGDYDPNTGTYKSLPLYKNNVVTPQKGAVYDKATNTLTLTDLTDRYELTAYMMGDDFTVRVEGDCVLKTVTCWTEDWGNGLRITGNGTLRINADKTQDTGIMIHRESGAKGPLTVDKSVTLEVYGTVSAIRIFRGEDSAATADGKPLPFNRKPSVWEGYVWVEGYSDVRELSLPLCRSEADPEGIYALFEEFDNKTETTVLTVHRYDYLEKYGLYFLDYGWPAEEKSGKGLCFSSREEAAAAGYSAVLDEHGEQKWLDVRTPFQFNGEQVFEDAEGNRYVLLDGRDDEGEYVAFACTFTPIEGLKDKYLFNKAPDVDITELEEAYEERTLEGLYDFSYPETEYVHTGTQTQPAFLRGDVDGDGTISASDARLALRRAVNLETYPKGSAQFLACDAEPDGEITAGDARRILRAAVNLEDPATW